MSRVSTIWRRHFLIVDTCAVIAAALALFIWAYYYEGAACINDILEENRATVYRSTVGMAASLLGFSLTIIAVVVGFSSYERLAVVRESKHYPTLWETFFSTVTALTILLIISFVSLLFDRDDRPLLWLEVVFFSFFVLSMVRLVRSITMLKRIVWLIAKPSPRNDNSFPEES